MRKLSTLVLAVLAFLASMLAPRCAAQRLSPEELKQLAIEKETKQEELITLEKETARAMQWSNGTLFRRVYGDDFVGILATGQTMGKAAWIASVENSSNKYASFIASDVRVRMYLDTAVVTCLWSARGTQGGRSFSRQWRVTHVYVYGLRGWQGVSSQETLLPG